MPKGRPKSIFIHGDEDKAFEFIKKLKSDWHPEGSVSCEWEEYEPLSKRSKGTSIEALFESLSYSPINECHRTFVLKTPGDNVKTKQALIKVVSNIPDNTTLIVWDTKGLKAGKKQSSPTWTEVIKAFSTYGEVIDTGKSLGELSEVSQVSWVVKEGEACGLTIPKECAELLLNLFDSNRIMILSEIQNLAFMSELVLDRETVLENAMPVQKDYPIYKFYSAFNSGSYRQCMNAAQELIDRGFSVDVLLGFAVKQARWQVVVADAIRKRKDPKIFTSELSMANHSKAREKLEKDKSLNSRLFFQNPSEMEDDDLPKKEAPPSTFAIMEMQNFIYGTMSKLIPETEKDKRHFIYEQLMRRYVTLLDSRLELRSCKSEEKESCFARVIRRVTF